MTLRTLGATNCGACGCVGDDVTCSRDGLNGDSMAATSCSRWNARPRYSCAAPGRIYFQ